MYKIGKTEFLTIKEWGLRFGIKVKKPTGFYGKRSQVWNRGYTRRQFERGIKYSQITVNTEKGLNFLESLKGGKKHGYIV